ncbi:MAG: deoxyribonuclease HsdR [Flavobacteriales bacterium]|nr:deoxyribonuclease HsdR [Flavobacteriales bacterium]|tara:strand:- start:4325 stop:5440 length:1116 start_codon:yes stop_codon:yes gene_type:complete
MKNIIIIILISFISFFLFQKKEKPYTVNTPIHNINYSSNNTIDFRLAAKKGTKSVVHVTAYKEDVEQYMYFDHFFGFYDQYQIPNQKYTSGSGVIVSHDGYIITNNHVIKGFEEVSVSLHNGQEYSGKVVATDPSTDLALLKIDAKNLTILNFANSDLVEIGQWVLAIGNPLNLNSTVTSGIVSAKARNINILNQQYAIESFIQTDAAVNPGNSGGALVDLNGNLIGINTAIASTTGAYSGYSFAIPSNIVNKVYNDLLNYGVVQRAFLGIYIQEMSPKLANELNIKFTAGIYVNGYTANSNAESAGIREGDIITQVDNYQVNNIPELQEVLLKKNPGMNVKITINRNGKIKIFDVQLTNKEGGIDVIKKS